MEIKDIKQTLNILSVAVHYGCKPNRNNLIECPFHEDDKPSLQLYPKTNTWHCFGCGKGTDGIDFIKLKENSTTHDAINKAKELLQYLPIKNIKPMQTKAVKELTALQRTETLIKAFSYFARSTKAEAKKYLEKRELNPAKITVGYDGHNFHKDKEVTAEQKELYLATGLIYPDKLGRENNYHSFFDGCIVFPILNEKGDIVNLYGRSIDESKESKHRYLPGKHQGIYPHYPKAETEKLIITECIIDAATLLQIPEIAGKYELMSCYGTNNFTVEHLNAIKNLQALKEVILFYDGDKAGREAIEAHAKIIKEINPNIKISHVETPDNEDINSLLQGHEMAVFNDLLSNRKFFLSQDQVQQNDNPMKEKNANEEIKNDKPIADNDAKHLEKLNTDNSEQLIFENEYLTLTIWGGIEIYNIKKLRATLHLQSRNSEYLEYRDTVDLYSHNHTERLIREAGERLEIGTNTMSKTITTLTKALEQYRQKERDKQRKREEEERNKNRETFTSQELQAGDRFLKDKNLMQKTEAHIHNIGLVGEEEKGMLLFFILLTRMFTEPLHALVQGKSGSGKTYLLKKIASLVPKSQIRITTALTENTLYHSLKDFWKHMILLIEDLDGAFNALLPLREMMSNQSISKLSTEKDLKTGEFVQKMLHVQGPVCVAGATTKDRIYEDNANRSFLIQVNETNEHQERVLDYQRNDIAGLLDKSKQQQTQIILKTAQLHLETLEVVIPFGKELRIPDYVFKKLRTNAHYLTLIKAIAFWNQKQREIKQKMDGTRYIEATLQDVEWANRLSKDVLLKKSDELNGTLRDFFESLKNHVRQYKGNTFFASKIRSWFRLHPQQLTRWLAELRQRGYIKQISKSQKTGHEYEILIWDDYDTLKSGIDLLDKVLEELRRKYKK
jgi:DNA primase catalytic core